MVDVALDLNVVKDIIIPILGLILMVIIHNAILSNITGTRGQFWTSILVGIVLVLVALTIFNYSRSLMPVSNPLAIAGLLLILANIYSYLFGRIRLSLS